MRAIVPAASVIFLVIAGVSSGCRPDLDRSAGALILRFQNMPPAAERVRANVSSGAETFATEAPASSAEVLVESVPAGPVEISVEVLAATAVLKAVRAAATVTAGTTEVVVIDMGGGGGQDAGVVDSGHPPDEVRSGALTATIKLRDDGVTGGMVAGGHEMDAPVAYATFITDARRAFGGDPSGFSVASLSLSLSTLDAENVATLSDLFNGPVTVVIAGGTAALEVDVASSTISAGATSAGLVPSASADLAPLKSDLLAGTFQIGLRGPTHRTAQESFRADVVALIEFVAHR